MDGCGAIFSLILRRVTNSRRPLSKRFGGICGRWRKGILIRPFPWGHFTDVQSIYQLACIVIMILLLASLNYILITVSNAASRSQESWLTKGDGCGEGQRDLPVVGGDAADRVDCESVGMVVALAGVPFLKTVIGSGVGYADISWREVLVAALVLALGLGLVAGYYPAMLISRLKPVSVIKSFSAFRIRPRFSSDTGRRAVRCCVVLMMAAFVIDRQMELYQPQRPWIR